MFISIKNKIFFLIAVVVVVTVSSVGWFGFKSARDSYVSSAISNNKGVTKALSSEIKGVLETIPADIIYNANFHALVKLLVWQDLKDQRKIELWRNIYISALKDYILNKKLYYQIRILNKNGHEELLLKYDKQTEKIIQVADDKLQDKSKRDYFKEAIKLKKGKFYISAMTLNIENGIIENPYIPVVRYSTPLINENGELKGVLVLNFNARYILDEIMKVQKDSTDSKNYYLLNEKGYYLFNGDITKRWGFQLGHDYTFSVDYPDVLSRFKNKEDITFIEKNKIYSMHRIYPNKIESRYRFWYLVTEIDEDIALTSLDRFMNIFFMIMFVVITLSLILVNWYVTKLTNPLSKVKAQLEALANGVIKKEKIDYTAKDEIGQMITSTTIVVDAIENIIKQSSSVADGDFAKDVELLSKDDKLGLALRRMTSRLKEITTLASALAKGDYNVTLVVKSSEDKLGLALVDMVDYLKTITKLAESIAVGDLEVKYKAKGEDDRLGRAILQMISYLRTMLNQANTISRGDFSLSIDAKSKNDELGFALIKMTDMLRESSTKNKNEIYFSDGVSEFSDKITGLDDVNKLAKEAITTVSRYINASSSVLYTYDKQKQELNLIASYAYVSRSNLSNKFKLGDGIIGQVALEKEAILLKNIREDEFEIQSGTTLSKAKEVYAFPFIHEGEIFGVAEIMSFESITDIHKDYLAKCAIIFAATLHTTTQNWQIKSLLKQSQVAFEELQVKSEELQESNVQMEEQQQQLTIQSKDLRENNENLAKAKQEIDKRADELEKASQYKSEFLANMSHELRTPLNSIILLSKLLSQNKERTLSDKDIEKSDVINKAGNDLLFLINDILDLTKIESGNMELVNEKIFSGDFVDDMRGLFGAIADDKNLNFTITDNFNSNFITDKMKLSQVLKNILSNAFKFTKKGSVDMTIDSTNDELTISIEDTGIGIPSNKSEHIFDAFKQVDGSISREFGGTGLGLSITKTIIELMQGVIEVSSVIDKGSNFTIILPLKEGKKVKKESKIMQKMEQHVLTTFNDNKTEEESDDISFDSNELSGKNIMVVDDDSRNIFALTSTLESLDAEVFNAFNGKEALEMLDKTQERIDLILMDIMMPVMDGIDAIKKIRVDGKYKDIPIIATTANNMPEDKKKCLDAGANDYLCKPLKHNALIVMIKAWTR